MPTNCATITSMKTIRFGIIGDFQSSNPTHQATNAALNQAGLCTIEWLATDQPHDYTAYHALLCSPGSPYRSEGGAMEAIQYARENAVPLLGTCGGFQHIVLEYARNVAQISDAAHAENDPAASNLFLTRLVCSLAGKTLPITIQPGTEAHRHYGRDTAEESYYCNFGLNPDHRSTLINSGLVVSAWDDSGEVRIVELPGHPFFIGTLFVPQTREKHPLVAAFYQAAQARTTLR